MLSHPLPSLSPIPQNPSIEPLVDEVCNNFGTLIANGVIYLHYLMNTTSLTASNFNPPSSSVQTSFVDGPSPWPQGKEGGSGVSQIAQGDTRTDGKNETDMGGWISRSRASPIGESDMAENRQTVFVNLSWSNPSFVYQYGSHTFILVQ